MQSCVFCKIIKGEIPSAKIYEDEKILAFLDINPVNHGHVLVIPKAHHPKIEETPDAVVADIFVQSKKLIPAVKKAANADYVAISVVGTEVPHFHIHLIPRRHDDGLAQFWPTKKYGEKEMEAAAEKIRAAFLHQPNKRKNLGC
ncbi:MAG TPA: HIT family protein [Candidatus Paceibacterota bacterium]